MLIIFTQGFGFIQQKQYIVLSTVHVVANRWLRQAALLALTLALLEQAPDSPLAHWPLAPSRPAGAECPVPWVLLSDDYGSGRFCRREWDHAILTSSAYESNITYSTVLYNHSITRGTRTCSKPTFNYILLRYLDNRKFRSKRLKRWK